MKDKVGGDRQIPAPPDGVYGWVIVSLACLNMFFVLGITYAIGTMLDTLVQVCAFNTFAPGPILLLNLLSLFCSRLTPHTQ